MTDDRGWLASDNLSGVFYDIIKLSFGALNTATLVSTSNGLPVNIVADGVGIGGGTQYTEDAAAAANPVGNAPILIRSDTPAALVTTDGDNVAQRGTNYGAGYVQVVSSAGAFVDTFGGGTQYTEDAAAAANPVGNALIVVREDARAGSLTTTDGDNVAVRGTNAGEMYVKHVDTLPVSVATIPSHAVTNAGTFVVQITGDALTALQVIDNNEKILLDEQDGTPAQIEFADHGGDFSPTSANNLEVGTATNCQLAIASVANAASRQSTKVDLGAVRAPRYKVRAAIEFAATPTAGNRVELYWAASGSATAGTANAGGASGADSAYAGYSSNLAASVKQLELIGSFVCTAQVTGTVQVAECGYFVPGERYGSLVVVNNSGAAIHSDDVECNIVFDPVYSEIQ